MKSKVAPPAKAGPSNPKPVTTSKALTTAGHPHKPGEKCVLH